jgi:hypothetical protein
MAKILLGAAIGDARGSVGAHTFTKGRNGAVLRQKVSPVQPRSSSVLTIRSQFSALSKYWANQLLDDQRAGWNALAAITSYTNVFGNTYHPTGLQLFQSCNRNLDVIGEAHIDDAPDNLDVTGLLTVSADAAAASHAVLTAVDATLTSAEYAYSSHTGLVPAVGMQVTVAGFTTPGNNVTGTIIAATGGAAGSFSLALTSQEDETHAGTADGTGFSIAFTATPVDADTAVVVQCSPMHSAGRQSFGSARRQIYASALNAASPLDITSAYTALFGAFRSGTKIQARVFTVNSVNGAASTPISVTTTVA